MKHFTFRLNISEISSAVTDKLKLCTGCYTHIIAIYGWPEVADDVIFGCTMSWMACVNLILEKLEEERAVAANDNPIKRKPFFD